MKRYMPYNIRGYFQDNISIFLVEPQSDCISLLQASVIANSFNQRMLLLHNAVSNVSGLFINLKPHDLNNVGATHISYTKYVIQQSKVCFKAHSCLKNFIEQRSFLRTRGYLPICGMSNNYSYVHVQR